MKKTEEKIESARTKDIHIRFTESEWNELQSIATDFEMSVSDYVRWSVFQRKVTLHILIDDESSSLSKIRYQLDKIGTNINQITKVLNSGFVNPAMFQNELKSMFLEIHNEIDLLNRVQSETNSKWRKSISKYSKLYEFDKTMRGESDGND